MSCDWELWDKCESEPADDLTVYELSIKGRVGKIVLAMLTSHIFIFEVLIQCTSKSIVSFRKVVLRLLRPRVISTTMFLLLLSWHCKSLPDHFMNAAIPQTNRTNLTCRLLSSTSTVAIYYYNPDLKQRRMRK